MASVLCASDTIAVLTMVDEKKFPKLNTILFGEGAVNDAVAILIYRSVEQALRYSLVPGEVNFTTPLILGVVLNFFVLVFLSVLLGLFLSLLTSYLFKITPSINASPIKECSIIIIVAYGSYYISEVFHLSGIITLFCCGLGLSHYCFFNVSEEC
mmetsp:Transcript_35563/g.34605  ORF Transcript_35563/g.34605 Transcript_35563/m.34605 type:complete len:155 (+) Transcript_35563:424-888(+)